MTDWRKVGAVFLAVTSLVGCAERDAPLAPGTDRGFETVRAALTCHANVRARSFDCIPDAPALASANGAVIGGQGTYILLEASNVGYDGENEILSADVAIRNYLTQNLGTVDGVGADPTGVRIFFHLSPAVVSGSGEVTVENSDGSATFITSDAEYFQYSQALAPGKKSFPKTWRFNVPNTVEVFTFAVYVAAVAADEETIEPGLPIQARTFSPGGGHSCALTLAGNAYCWGIGLESQLGTGNTNNSYVPVLVAKPAGVKAVSISAGLSPNGCLLSSEGDAYCWGRGDEGQLGNGTTTTAATPVKVTAPPGVRFVWLEVGSNKTCGVTASGAAYCWGQGMAGALGNGATSDISTPDSVLAPEGVKFVSASAAWEHSCGLASSGDIYCWGNSGYGRMGISELWQTFTTPVPVESPVGVKFVSVGVSANHSCALARSGTAYCWGTNNSGEIGNGTASGIYVLLPDSVHAPAGVKFVSIGVGGSFNCGLSTTGVAYCWGQNNFGQLGRGSEGGFAVTPDSVHQSEGLRFVSLGVGLSHACGVTADGKAHCWGYGYGGRLGYGGTSNSSVPTQVSNLTNFAFRDAVSPGTGEQRPFLIGDGLVAYALAGARRGTLLDALGPSRQPRRNGDTPTTCVTGAA